MKKKLIEHIKKYIYRNPEMFLVRNKHRLNIQIMKQKFPKLTSFSDAELLDIFSTVVDVDRDVRKAKEEIREEHPRFQDSAEKDLLVYLQNLKKEELGYKV